MGCAFNCVIVPPEVQKEKDLKKFYQEYRTNLIEEYGGEEDFEGYTGDLASDDGTLEIKKDLKLSSDSILTEDDIGWLSGDLMDLCKGHCEKWGPSIAVKVGKQWVICGAYSD